MALVTTSTLKSFGFGFKTGSEADAIIDRVIGLHEKDYYDAALSPQLSDVYVSDPTIARFSEIREGFIDENNCRQKGLDYGVNAWCAWWIVKDGSLSIVDSKVSTPSSQNTIRLDANNDWGNEVYNFASKVVDSVTINIIENKEIFPEFTEGRSLGLKKYFWG